VTRFHGLLAALPLLLLPLAAHAAHAADPAGTIEICRMHAAGDRHEGKDIPIPSGAVFGDSGELKGGDHVGIYWPLWIATTQPLTLGAGDKCVTGAAKILRNLDKHRLRAADHRWFVPSGTATSTEDWPGNYDVGATVASDFK
jgi:hypothetical protein